MTLKEKRIAIAETCGWKPLSSSDLSWWRHAESKTVAKVCGLPDYPNDLNAMHEAEETLTPEQESKYAEILSQLEERDFKAGKGRRRWRWSYHYTAAQRAEAFLQTLNL